MTFYCINQEGKNAKTVGYLRRAAESRGLRFVVIYQDKFNFTEKIKTQPRDLLYRARITRKSANIEKYLLLKNNFTTFRRDRMDIFNRYDNVFEASLIQEANGLPIIKSVFGFTKNREILSTYVKYLGGFPVVLKATGGSHGIGVIRVDSIESLFSVADVLDGSNRTYIMRKYISDCRHARLIVVGDKVVASIEYKKDVDDFRTSDDDVASVDFGEQINEIAVKAVNILNVEFGGVDILIDKNKKPYIAEVNFPCYFPRAQDTADVDVAGMMLDYLINKAKNV